MTQGKQSPKPIDVHGRMIEAPEDILLAPYMNAERAKFMRQLRCIEGLSWRALAARCCEESGTDFGQGKAARIQMNGVALGSLASAYLGELWTDSAMSPAA